MFLNNQVSCPSFNGSSQLNAALRRPVSFLRSNASKVSLSALLPFNKSKFSGKRTPLDMNALSIWSCRFWALYVALQFVHLREDGKLLKKQERAVGKSKAIATQAERDELKKRWDALWSEFVVNLGYLPLTVHWSLEKGLFKNEIWVAVFGLIAALASWRSGWRATALPAATADASPSTSESSTAATPMNADILAHDPEDMEK
ncbi:hypothetical protein AcW1_010357 [Taiwanofungus camphoratus]|nr:hypothetical protein AcW1_010357 [Antrodia cinnamomea]